MKSGAGTMSRVRVPAAQTTMPVMKRWRVAVLEDAAAALSVTGSRERIEGS